MGLKQIRRTMSITNFLDVTVDWTGLNASYEVSADIFEYPVLLLEATFDGDNCTGNLVYGNIYSETLYIDSDETSPRSPGYCDDGEYRAWLNFTAYPSVTTEVNDVRGLFKYFASVAAETGLVPFLEAVNSSTSAVMVPYSYDGLSLSNKGDYGLSADNCADLQRQWDDGNFTTLFIADLDDATFDWSFYFNYTDAQTCAEALAFVSSFGENPYSNITGNLNCAGECFDFENTIRRRETILPFEVVGFALDKAGIMELFPVDDSSSSESDSDPSGSSRSAVGIMGTLAVVAVSLTML